MKVGLYARVSTKDKEQNPENQLLKLREYCKSKGWSYKEYTDFAPCLWLIPWHKGLLSWFHLPIFIP